MRTRRAGLLLFLLLLPTALPAQDGKDQEGEAFASRLVGAAWCAVRPKEDRGTELEEGELGCDGGVGAAFWKRGHFAGVVVIGARSAGPGGAYIFNPGANRPIAVAAGVVLPWDTTAIYMEPTFVLGITVSFWQGGSE